MILGKKLVRYAALALLLSAGIDLFVVDLSLPSLCTETGTTSGAGKNPSGENPFSPGNTNDRRDDCFCCCSHVVTSHAVELLPLQLLPFTFTSADTAGPATEPSLIYHPPKDLIS